MIWRALLILAGVATGAALWQLRPVQPAKCLMIVQPFLYAGRCP